MDHRAESIGVVDSKDFDRLIVLRELVRQILHRPRRVSLR